MDANQSRQVVLARLAESREEVRRILDPPRVAAGPADQEGSSSDGSFPRSRTMRALLSNRGIGAAGALAGGLLIARPALALRLLRLVPLSTVGRMLLAKAIGSLRSKREP